MKKVKILFAIFFCVLIVSLQSSYAQDVKFIIDYKSAAEPGERFNKGFGQCVDFVKQSRSDLTNIGKVNTAANMPNVAKEKGFEVNNLPREGAAIIMPDVKIIKTGEITGHVAIVTKVEENKDGLFTLTIRDANAKNDIKYDKDGKIIQGSTVIERTVTYDTKERKVVDGILKEQSNIIFIHEKKDIYNTKQKEASEYVTQAFKDLGKEPSADEKEKYMGKLFSGAVSSEQIKSTIERSPAPQPKPANAKTETIAKKTSEDESIKILKERVEVLKEEIKKAQTQIQSKTEAWNRVKEGFINIGITIFNHIMKAKIPTGIYIPEGFLPQELQASALNTFDKDKLTGLDQKGGQQQLTPVKVTFTQTFNGLYTQTPIAHSSQAADFTVNITSGTRGPLEVREVRPGNFTGLLQGRVTAYPGDMPGTYNNDPVIGWSVGTVEAKGFKEGPLKGEMQVQGIHHGVLSILPKGPVTINTDGSLSHTFNGVVIEGGVNWGTANGTLNQTKTTP